MRQQPSQNAHHQRLLAAAMLWLIGGSALLLTTLIPMHTDLLGWAPAFWLLGAPLIVLLALEPSRPRAWLANRRPRRRASHGLIWH